MLTFDKSSWHYRFATAYGGMYLPNTNLCPYVRKVVKGLFIFTGAAAVICALAALWLYCVTTSVYTLLYISDPELMRESWGILMLCFSPLLVLLVMLLGALTISGSYKLVGYTSTQVMTRVEKSPSLVFSYIRAIHDKVCPQITFTTNYKDSQDVHPL